MTDDATNWPMNEMNEALQKALRTLQDEDGERNCGWEYTIMWGTRTWRNVLKMEILPCGVAFEKDGIEIYLLNDSVRIEGRRLAE